MNLTMLMKKVPLLNGKQRRQRHKRSSITENIPIDTFDLIVVDECHRSIYGKWRHVLEYFDAFIIGLTATPYGQTRNFFNQNLVYEYRTDPILRIAVSVDMISTGTDIKPLECLLFMRAVRSSGYFEQMIGRGVRTISTDDLRAVTGDATAKTHFIIVDAVGVFDSLKPIHRHSLVNHLPLIQMARRQETRIR